MYQFIHISSYSSTGSKKSASTANVQSIVGEAARQAAYVKHIAETHEPVTLYGCSPIDAGEAAKTWGKRNKIRKDGHILLAGVISVPAEFQNWQQYKSDCIDWLKEKYGTRLLSIVEHTDENHPHFHFYAVPMEGERFDGLHEGEKARNDLRAMKQSTGAQNKAYKEAMKKLQSSFHAAVAKPYGLAKDGPKRRRLSRSEYLAERDASNLIAAAHLDSSNLIAQAQLERIGIIDKTKGEAVEYIARQKKIASDAAAKIRSEALQIKQQAETIGFQQGQKSFERQPFIKKIRAVFYGLAQLADKQLKRIKQQLSSTKSQANSKLAAARGELADMQAEMASKEKSIQHLSKIYTDVCKKNTDLIRESRKMGTLNFSTSANSYDHLQKPK